VVRLLKLSAGVGIPILFPFTPALANEAIAAKGVFLVLGEKSKGRLQQMDQRVL